MENIICVSIVAVVVVVLLLKMMKFTGEYDDADLSINRTGKNGKSFAISFKGKRKLEDK